MPTAFPFYFMCLTMYYCTHTLYIHMQLPSHYWPKYSPNWLALAVSEVIINFSGILITISLAYTTTHGVQCTMRYLGQI